MVGANGEFKNHVADLQSLIATKSGYVYIYCSNESPVNVFFDNLQVVQTRGPILEETHYYPFGLIQVGISSKAAGTIQNKEKTFQGQRFDDDFGLNWIQFKWRNHDPQIGRFIEVDPLSEKYVSNSTYAFSENKVTAHVELEGLESVSVNPVADFVVNKVLEWRNDLQDGKRNLQEGAVRKAEALTGANDHLPQAIQKIKSTTADVQIAAGVAQMVKPGLEAASYVASTAVGVEIPVEAGLLTKPPSLGFTASVSSTSSPAKLGQPSFIVDGGGQTFPVPKGATGPLQVRSGNGVQFTGGEGGANGQVSTMRIMDPVPAKGNAPAYPNGYIKYENSQGQGVSPYTGRTGSKAEVHISLWQF